MVAAVKRKFGRTYIADERDEDFPIRAKATSRTNRYWNNTGWWGDQKATPLCVGYAFAHWYEDGPITHSAKPVPVAKPQVVYDLAQELDEWEGTAYSGTSIRAGAKAMKVLGYISEYRWTYDLPTMIATVLELGPVVVGTTWWSDMFVPNKAGVIRATGFVCGGHAYVINGVNVAKKLFRLKNSWGKTWALNGSAFISFADMAMLIEQMDGECCLATEVPG